MVMDRERRLLTYEGQLARNGLPTPAFEGLSWVTGMGVALLAVGLNGPSRFGD